MKSENTTFGKSKEASPSDRNAQQRKNIQILAVLLSMAITFLGAFGGAVWWVAITHASIERMAEDLETVSEDLRGDLETVSKDLETVSKDLETVSEDLREKYQEVRVDINVLSGSVNRIEGILSSNMVILRPLNPIQLTAYGEKLFRDVDGQRIVENHLNGVETKTDMAEFQLAYADQPFLTLDRLSDGEKATVLSVASAEGIRVAEILNVLDIRFRNELTNKMTTIIH